MDKRFQVLYTQGFSPRYEIIVDNVTGVNYIYRSSGYGGGLTPLLDAYGKPIVTPYIGE